MPPRKRLTTAQGAIRHAVRQSLERHTKPPQKLLVAVSGGADSLALAAAVEFEAKKLELEIAAAIIDHSLQKNSDRVALRAKKTLQDIGFSQVVIRQVQVGKSGGPEAAARSARYKALEEIKSETKANLILLGHTMNDQAETVLLGLVRGSGPKSISGMSELTGNYLRPLLEIERSETERFCVDSGISFWRDPQNNDTRFLRVLLRKKVIPFLEKQLGGGVLKSLVRTAAQLREDDEYLDLQANKAYKKVASNTGSTIRLQVEDLENLPTALRNRVIKLALDELESQSSRGHVLAVADLVLNWHGQKPITLPGVRVERRAKTITMKTNREN